MSSLPHALRYASSLPGLLSGVALGVGQCELACGPGGVFWGGVAAPGALVGTCYGTGFVLGWLSPCGHRGVQGRTQCTSGQLSHSCDLSGHQDQALCPALLTYVAGVSPWPHVLGMLCRAVKPQPGRWVYLGLEGFFAEKRPVAATKWQSKYAEGPYTPTPWLVTQT